MKILSLDTFLLHCNNSRNFSAILLMIQDVALENKLFFVFVFVDHQEFACVRVHDRCGWVLGASSQLQQFLTTLQFSAVKEPWPWNNSKKKWNMWRKINILDLNFFSSQKFLYLVYPTEKTALFYTIFIHYIPLCNRKGHLEFLLIRRLWSSKSQYFYI